MRREIGEISDHVRVGLALGGGGARGLAQVGVLKVLERERVPIHLIAGTSIGAIIGGLYVCSTDTVELERRVKHTLLSRGMEGLDLERVRKLSGVAPVAEGKEADTEGLLGRARKIFRRVIASHAALTRMAVLDGEVVLEMFETLFGASTFDQTKIPFAAVAVDLQQCCQVIIASGALARAVAASSAIAGIFPPVEIDGRLLIDGGYTSPVPIEAAQTLGANVVIAVDVREGGLDRGRLDNAVEVAMRSNEISLIALEREQLRRADIVIPARGAPRHWSDYSHPEEAIAAGEVAAERMIDSIHSAIEERGRLFI